MRANWSSAIWLQQILLKGYEKITMSLTSLYDQLIMQFIERKLDLYLIENFLSNFLFNWKNFTHCILARAEVLVNLPVYFWFFSPGEYQYFLHRARWWCHMICCVLCIACEWLERKKVNYLKYQVSNTDYYIAQAIDMEISRHFKKRIASSQFKQLDVAPTLKS